MEVPVILSNDETLLMELLVIVSNEDKMITESESCMIIT